MRGALTPISGRPEGYRHKNMFTGDLTELLLWVWNGLLLRADSGFITDVCTMLRVFVLHRDHRGTVRFFT